MQLEAQIAFGLPVSGGNLWLTEGLVINFGLPHFLFVGVLLFALKPFLVRFLHLPRRNQACVSGARSSRGGEREGT